MKTVTLFFLAIFLSFSAFTQDTGKTSHTIKGKIINSNSNQPISFTNIGLVGTLYGTASDEDGNFELKVSGDMLNKKIYFSAVGFQNKQFTVKYFLEKQFSIVKLKPQSYGVEEVNVAAQNKVLIRILRMASENIKYNYGAGPFNMHCNYTNQFLIEDKTKTEEISVLIYDAKGYRTPSKLDAFNSRNYSLVKKDSSEAYSFSSGLINIDDLLELDWVRSASNILAPALLTDYKLEMESQPTIEGQQYWVVAFKQDRPSLEGSGDFYASKFKGRITISKANYSVLKIEGEVESQKNNRQGRGLAVGKSNKNFVTDVNYTFTVDYSNLLLKKVTLNKTYLEEGNKVSQKSTLEINRTHTNNLNKLSKRDYFLEALP